MSCFFFFFSVLFHWYFRPLMAWGSETLLLRGTAFALSAVDWPLQESQDVVVVDGDVCLPLVWEGL